MYEEVFEYRALAEQDPDQRKLFKTLSETAKQIKDELTVPAAEPESGEEKEDAHMNKKDHDSSGSEDDLTGESKGNSRLINQLIIHCAALDQLQKEAEAERDPVKRHDLAQKIRYRERMINFISGRMSAGYLAEVPEMIAQAFTAGMQEMLEGWR